MLSSIIKGPEQKPPIVTIHGAEGVGKTTLAAGAPKPIMIPTEDGASQVGIDRFPLVKTYAGAIKALDSLLTEDHAYETVVIDSLDWLERLVHAKVAADAGVKSVSEIPYGKGFQRAISDWGSILDRLTRLRDDKAMAIVLICHTEVKRQEHPEVEAFDKSVLKLHKDAAALIVEFSDIVGFAAIDMFVKSTDAGFGRQVTRAVSTNKRCLRLHPNPAYTAKTRYNLPASIPLSWASFIDAFVAAMVKNSVKSVIESSNNEGESHV